MVEALAVIYLIRGRRVLGQVFKIKSEGWDFLLADYTELFYSSVGVKLLNVSKSIGLDTLWVLSLFVDDYFVHHISLSDGIYYLQPFKYSPKCSMVPV